MKSILFYFAFVFIGITAFAKPIDQNTAKQVAVNYLNEITYSQSATNLKLVYQSVSPDKSTVYFYVFGNDKSFVMVSADDRTIPVLGYSAENGFSPDHVSPGLNYVLSGYNNNISSVISNNVPASQEITNQWVGLINGTPAMDKAGTIVAELMKTTWDQSPFYNDLCPYDVDSSQLTVTGCVATAMAQVLKYWNYPSVGLGSYTYDDYQYGQLSASFESTSYDWSAMTNTVKSANNAVATLMYHCGVAVQMHYGIASMGGSSAYVIDDNGRNPYSAEDALKSYFGYATTLKGVQRKSYSDADWINLLENELDNKRPIIYSGFETTGEGHCFVFDGYNGTKSTFHVNWGWGGYNNAFYTVSALNPPGVGIGGGSGDFNLNQAAIIGIQPATGQSGVQNAVIPASNVNMYPNPAKDVINLNFNDASTKPLQISLVNSQGQEVYSEIPSISNSNISLITSTLPAGMYIVKVTTDKGVWNSKVVVEK